MLCCLHVHGGLNPRSQAPRIKPCLASAPTNHPVTMTVRYYALKVAASKGFKGLFAGSRYLPHHPSSPPTPPSLLGCMSSHRERIGLWFCVQLPGIVYPFCMDGRAFIRYMLGGPLDQGGGESTQKSICNNNML